MSGHNQENGLENPGAGQYVSLKKKNFHKLLVFHSLWKSESCSCQPKLAVLGFNFFAGLALQKKLDK